jgi:hypothetical protein
MSIEAMKQALEALEKVKDMAWSEDTAEGRKTMEALRAAIEQGRSEQWWKHEVSNAWAEGYEKGRAQREWKGLTDEEVRAFEVWLDDEEEKHGWNPPQDIIKYIEAKLKEKNT